MLVTIIFDAAYELNIFTVCLLANVTSNRSEFLFSCIWVKQDSNASEYGATASLLTDNGWVTESF